MPSPDTGRTPLLVVAHRGFSGAAPENTLASFRKAIEIGAGMLECDVRLSRDGHVVVIHDSSVDRTTDGRGRVTELTLQEIKGLDAGSRFAPGFAGERIPTLGELLSLAKGRVRVNIEIKGDELSLFAIQKLTDATCQEVRSAGIMDQVCFSSFQLAALERVREHDSTARRALLYHRPWNNLRDIPGGQGYDTLNLRFTHLTKEKVEAIHREGKAVNVYTVNDESDMRRFVQWGVDGIITDRPDRLLGILREKDRE